MGELSGDPEGSTEENMRHRRPECGQLEGSGRRNMAALAEPWFVPSLDDARDALACLGMNFLDCRRKNRSRLGDGAFD